MKSGLAVIFLFCAGLLLLGIGGGILLVPHAFYASDGIGLGNDPSLLSEIRAPGGLLTGSGILILAGTFRPDLRSLAVMLTVLVYGSFGVSRLIGFALDGMPSERLIMASAIELVIATLAIALFGHRSGKDPTTSS